VEGVTRLTGGRIDAIVANAGGGPAETMLALNFFGAVATLEGLRPLLASSSAPRAAMVSSISSLSPSAPALVDSCLAQDETTAGRIADAALSAGRGPLELYGAAKHALNRWCRSVASQPQWAGAGIPINVAALGFFDTPAAAYILTNPDLRARMEAMVPLRGAAPGRPDEAAAALAWLVGPENSQITGQILFVDGGMECQARGGLPQ